MNFRTSTRADRSSTSLPLRPKSPGLRSVVTRFRLLALLPLTLPVSAASIDLAPAGKIEYQYVGAQVRHQTVYDAGMFGGIESITIERVAFYSNGDPTPGTSTVTLSLSTMPFGSGLSRVAAENIGSDAATVYTGAWSGTSPGAGFNMWLDLTTPFTYRPSEGNLMMDLQNNRGLIPVPVRREGNIRAARRTHAGRRYPGARWSIRSRCRAGSLNWRARSPATPRTAFAAETEAPAPLTQTPEPGMAALVTAGLALLCAGRRLSKPYPGA